MGKRYYCEYCDRSFVDDKEARKKHLNGSVHIRLRKEHYDQFKDAKTILAEESAKVPCKRFQRYNECVFGSNCRYSHYLYQDLENLRKQVEYEKELEELKKAQAHKEGPTLASWLQKRSQVKLIAKNSGDASSLLMWDVAPCLQGRMDLPPSLQPMKIDDFTHSDFESWG